MWAIYFHFFSGALSVFVIPATQSAVFGDNSVVIQCTVIGIPQATSWYWTFTPLGSGSGSQTITQGTNNGDYTVSNSNTNPHLTIKTITTADAGDYICRATNVVGTSSSPQSRLAVTGGKLNIYMFVLLLYSIFCNLFLAYKQKCVVRWDV